MFAVVEIAGKQYRVSPGDRISVERLEAEPGSDITLDSVLLMSTDDGVTVGTPLIAGAKVSAQVVGGRERQQSACVQVQAQESLSDPLRPPPHLYRSRY